MRNPRLGPFAPLRWSRPAAALMCALLAASGCGSGEESAEAKSSGKTKRINVTVAPVETTDVVERVRSVGTIQALHRIQMAAEVAGTVASIRAEEGDEVAAGDLLATLEEEPFRLAVQRAQAQVGRLEAQIANQRREIERLEKLKERDYSREAELDQARTRLDVLRQELSGAQAELGLRQRDLDKSRLKAPLRATVQERLVAPGDYVRPGDPAYRLAVTHRLKLRFPVPETRLERIRPGLPVTVETPLAPGRSFSGKVKSLLPEVSEDSRNARVLVEMDNPGPLRPGATARAAIRIGTREGALMAPEGCIVARPAGSVVYRVGKDGESVTEVAVKTGLRQNGRVEIRSGVEAGDRLVKDGAQNLTDGAAIRVREPEG